MVRREERRGGEEMLQQRAPLLLEPGRGKERKERKGASLVTARSPEGKEEEDLRFPELNKNSVQKGFGSVNQYKGEGERVPE